jgi:predicted HTH domain antitoxin
MSIQIDIPDSVAQALRLPPAEQREQLLIELAVSLYARGLLSFGKARELCDLGHFDFGRLLGKRGIPRHYGPEDLHDDVTYAGR